MKEKSPWLAWQIHSQVYPSKLFSFYYLYTNLCYISVSVTASAEDLGYCDFSRYITRRLFLLSYVSKKKLHLPNPSLSFAMTLWQCTAIRTSCHKATDSANWMAICTGITLCVTDHFWGSSEYTVDLIEKDVKLSWYFSILTVPLSSLPFLHICTFRLNQWLPINRDVSRNVASREF